MARRKSVNFIRNIGVDSRFGSESVQKLINVVMERGKKSIARQIVYDAFEVLIKKAQGDSDKALKIFSKALEQITPVVEVRPRRVGGSVYQIPVEVGEHRGRSLALRWLVSSAAVRKDKTMGLRLAHELLDAYDGTGNAFKKKIDAHKIADSNRAFAHFAW